ncbi:MAG: TetR/AcrR family transcriptional regulator [Opitutaceae bacterium]|jgi:AcrR family transcriptional regulator
MPSIASLPPPLPLSTETAARDRILQQARETFFAQGYSAFLMDDLASSLGMSKKTLYRHFTGKDDLIRAVIDGLVTEIRADADALLGNRMLGFSEKLRGFTEGMMERMQALTPATLHDLQRCAPELHALVSEMRQKNIPYIFGRLIEEGQLAGVVRTDLPSGFAVEFYLQAINGLLQPPSLDHLQLAPREVIARAIELFFGGLLTPSGRKEHEKLFPR